MRQEKQTQQQKQKHRMIVVLLMMVTIMALALLRNGVSAQESSFEYLQLFGDSQETFEASIPIEHDVLLLSDANFEQAIRAFRPLFVLFDSPVKFYFFLWSFAFSWASSNCVCPNRFDREVFRFFKNFPTLQVQ
jgi:hypothetical protein